MRYEPAEISRNRAVRFADADAARLAIDQPGADDGMVAVEQRNRGDRLVDEPFLAVIARRLDPGVADVGDVGALA